MIAIDPVDALLAAHGYEGRWSTLNATGVANRIYATADVVLRVATDHPDAEPDARTESVAAPAAHAAGIRTARLLAFDDSRALVDRPFSIWERIHGETAGAAALDGQQRRLLWREIGEEIARLHGGVRDCPDPLGYLDTPGYERDLAPIVDRLVEVGAVSADAAGEISRFVDELAPHVSHAEYERCFVHNDLHAMNVMCTPAGALLALIDWGDAGWGDPTLDFVGAPLEMISAMFEGYGRANRAKLGSHPEARIVWAKLHEAMEDSLDTPGRPIPLALFKGFLGA